MPYLHRLPLHVLPTFCSVARQPNLRAAATALHLTHSAISQQIKLLEQRLDTPLFDRRGRRLVLNAAGQALLDAAEPALAQLQQGVAAARAAGSGEPQTLRLSTIPSFAQRWLLPRMARWRERQPTLMLELHTSQSLVDLARDGFHAAVRQGHGPWKGLHAERLFDSPLVPVAEPATAARLTGHGPKALADEPLLGDARIWGRWFEQAGLQVVARPVASFSDAGLMLQAAEQGLGVTLARDLLVADALRAGRLVRLPGPTLVDDTVLPLWLVYPPALAASPGIQALREWLHDELAASADWLGQRADAAAASTTPSG